MFDIDFGHVATALFGALVLAGVSVSAAVGPAVGTAPVAYAAAGVQSSAVLNG